MGNLAAELLRRLRLPRVHIGCQLRYAQAARNECAVCHGSIPNCTDPIWYLQLHARGSRLAHLDDYSRRGIFSFALSSSQAGSNPEGTTNTKV